MLLSLWRGLTWSPDNWTSINSIGVARWAGAISLHDLQRWDPQVAALVPPGATTLQQGLADIALVRQALILYLGHKVKMTELIEDSD